MTAGRDMAIEVHGLAKRFDDVQAVAGIDFDVREGELFGFLGPNGAGKSTTINMLIGLARPDAGTIHIAGIDCSKNPPSSTMHSCSWSNPFPARHVRPRTCAVSLSPPDSAVNQIEVPTAA